MHGSELKTDSRSPERGSGHSVAVWHAEAGHRVEDHTREPHLNSLPIQSSTSHTSADDRLVPEDGILDHAALAVARGPVPLAPSEFSDRADVPVPLPHGSRGPRMQSGVAPGWNEHSHSVTLTSVMSGFVHGLGVVRTVRRDGGYPIVDLLHQGEHPHTVRCPSASQIRGDDLTRIGIDSEVQLPPGLVLGRFPQMADMNPEPRTVDEQMDGSIRGEPPELDLAELLEPSGQRSVIRDREIDLE